MTGDETTSNDKSASRERVLIENARRRVRGTKKAASKPTGHSRQAPTYDEFSAVLLKSRLSDRRTLEERTREFSSGERKLSAREFARFLIERGDLTKYQAERLLAGRSEGFFLGDCKILGVLGAGGMGKVYLAEQMRLGRQVAVKVLASHRAEDAAARARFLREARSVAELKHPNIVQIHDVGEKGKTLYIIMELVRGESLGERLRRQGPMSVAESVSIVRQVAAGLQHACEHGIVHRDIKPSNLVLEDGNVKILDLGLARKFDADDSLTQEGSGMGTPDYMSPEQFTDAHKADVRSDLYSLGCTWYHLLTGRPPFSGSSAVEKGMSHINTPPPSVQSVAPSVPGDLAAVIAKLMAKKPADRYQTPQELLADIRDWSGAAPDPDATQAWSLGEATLGMRDTAGGATAVAESTRPTASTPVPADEPSSATLVSAPSASVPSFLLYLIPVMGALVLGGAYFGIKALLEAQGEAEQLVVKIPKEKNDETGKPAGTTDAAETNGGESTALANPQGDGEPQQDATVTVPPVEETPKTPVPRKSPDEDVTADPPDTPVDPKPEVPARPAKTWRFANASAWQDAWDEMADGDRIELDRGPTFELGGRVLAMQGRSLTLAAADEDARPVVRWTLPGDRRFADGLVQVAQGKVVVEGIDFYVDLKNQNATDSTLVLFALAQADLHLIDCSVTVLNARRRPVTVAALNDERPWDAKAKGDPPAPVFLEVRDSMVRGADTVVSVDSRQARVSIEQSIVCGSGGLVHVFHTRPLEFAHHGVRLDVGTSVLDMGGPFVAVDCRPFDLRPVPLQIGVTSSLLMNPSLTMRPPQVAWKSPVKTETVSSALRWTGRENYYFQRGSGLTAKTAAGPVVTLVQSPDDWKRQELGEETGWKVVPRIRAVRIPYEERVPDEYKFARDIGIDLRQVARPPRRLRK